MNRPFVRSPLFGVLLLCAVCLFLGGGVLTVLAFSRPHGTSGNSSWLPSSDPWSECAAIREWLRTHSNDPKSVEIVEWEKRWDAPDTKDTRVVVRYRTRNGLGAIVHTRSIFVLRNNQVLAEAPWDS